VNEDRRVPGAMSGRPECRGDVTADETSKPRAQSHKAAALFAPRP